MKLVKRLSLLVGLVLPFTLIAQQVPSPEENIEFLTTFSKEADSQWGDDDHVQIFFFVVPRSTVGSVFIKIFDPEISGLNDVKNNDSLFNSSTKFSIYGGSGAFTNPDSRKIDPNGYYTAGTLLNSKTFDSNPTYDNKWFTFGPFNVVEGEYVEQFDGYVFKVIAQGLTGDDGNHYRYFLSTDKNINRPVVGGNAFTYEYTFKLFNNRGSVAHIYPVVDNNVIALNQHNFDFDYEGVIKIYSIAKNGHNVMLSNDNTWETSEHRILEKEQGKSLDIQIIKSKNRINDMTFYIVNQYNEAIPFFAVPIGGVPKYKYKVDVKYNYKRHPTSTSK